MEDKTEVAKLKEVFKILQEKTEKSLLIIIIMMLMFKWFGKFAKKKQMKRFMRNLIGISNEKIDELFNDREK